ncbi:MAG: hypothetical protein ACLVB5_07760 [Christensenellales bacterium]
MYSWWIPSLRFDVGRAQSADIPILRKIGENVNHKKRAISRNFRNIKKEEKRLSRRRGMGV